ncbi:low specificity L-threonine aldolase [Modestobacter sp. I12A-02628]|uniref:Low specificity L-threonine aldolase n=1 Tax=Goekera deserti TaxID=2497753 RepID=A0A7K3WAH7_9ACTN|nr:GntG family PLP-dependent aldolase [Goekera deserti]MPQ97676.1 low specificity L-threonine aldolase [Goekera deserti]NDI47657.1 low specificity L-threonine aldolase [Goekera deserti]NDI47720.1 low specificity L-threonine aldolase [Goekera deserti]NEL53468.1 low specificity L-threonine aldolase [Goekera deserti]
MTYSLVDLRSDTVTRPTDGMRRAMAEAEVGDDVYGEDACVNALEERVADLFGHEAALFVPSGTMGNQIGMRLVCEPGQEVLGDAEAHVVTYEMGAAAAVFGLSTRTVVSAGCRLDAAQLIEQVRPRGDWHLTATAAIAVENTHNRGGGLVQPLDQLQQLWDWSRGAGVAVHLDGARVWNAAVASGVPLSTYGRLADTASVCLSKGLGAPVGSVLVAGAERIAAARLWRKRLGGGMRQAGVLAAAGLHALDHHLDRLADDHARARTLAERLGADPSRVETNMVVLEDVAAPVVAEAARAQGVLVGQVGPRRIRLVTHLDVDDAAVDRAATVLGDLLRR